MAVRGWLLSNAPLIALGAGVAWVGAFAACELAAATIETDIGTICDAEARSGLSLDHDMGRLSAWVLAHLRTPSGAYLFRELRDEPLGERARDLEARARAASLPSCPLAAAYEGLTSASRYRSDVQQACSRFTFPGLGDLPHAERVQRLAEWLDTQGSSPRSRALSAVIRQEPRIEDAQQWMRNASREAGSFSCDIAAALGAPAPASACVQPRQ